MLLVYLAFKLNKFHEPTMPDFSVHKNNISCSANQDLKISVTRDDVMTVTLSKKYLTVLFIDFFKSDFDLRPNFHFLWTSDFIIRKIHIFSPYLLRHSKWVCMSDFNAD